MLVATSLVLATTSSLHAGQLVREFRGDRSMTTAEFRVEAPWILDWRLNGDYEQMMALDVQLVDARTGIAVGRIKHIKTRGTGVRLFKKGGTYKFRVSSTLARWTLRVEQLTEEEAELYTPVERWPFAQ